MKNLLLFSVLLLCLQSCVVHKKDSLDMQEGLKSFGKTNSSNSILLIDKITTGPYKKLYNKRRMGDCKQFYQGNVEAIVMKEVNTNPKYADKNIYRYVLSDASVTTYRFYTTPQANGKYSDKKVISNFSLYDRVTGESIDLNVAGVNPDRVFKKAVQKLNEYLNGK